MAFAYHFAIELSLYEPVADNIDYYDVDYFTKKA